MPPPLSPAVFAVPEVFANILGLIDTDAALRTLKACSLVSRGWHAMAMDAFWKSPGAGWDLTVLLRLMPEQVGEAVFEHAWAGITLDDATRRRLQFGLDHIQTLAVPIDPLTARSHALGIRGRLPLALEAWQFALPLFPHLSSLTVALELAADVDRLRLLLQGVSALEHLSLSVSGVDSGVHVLDILRSNLVMRTTLRSFHLAVPDEMVEAIVRRFVRRLSNLRVLHLIEFYAPSPDEWMWLLDLLPDRCSSLIVLPQTMTSSGLVSPHHQDDRLRTIQIGPVKIRRLLSMLEHLEVTGLEEFTCIVRDHGDNPGAGIAWLSIMERVALNTRLAKIRISAVLGEQDELPIITSSCLLPLATCSHLRLFSLAASSTDEDSAPVWLYDDLGRLLRAWPRLEELCICHPVLDAAAPSFVGLVPIGLLEDVRRLCPALARIELAVDPDTAVEWAPAIPDVPCLREVHVRVEIHALTVAEITGKVYILYPHANVRVRAGGLSSTGAVGEEGNSMQELHRIALYHKESCCIQGVEDEQDDE